MELISFEQIALHVLLCLRLLMVGTNAQDRALGLLCESLQLLLIQLLRTVLTPCVLFHTVHEQETLVALCHLRTTLCGSKQLLPIAL